MVTEQEFMGQKLFEYIKKIVLSNDIHSISDCIYNNKDRISKEQLDELNEIYLNRKILRYAKKGLRAFTIDGISVLAMNEKNAKRKVANIKSCTK